MSGVLCTESLPEGDTKRGENGAWKWREWLKADDIT